MAHRVVGSISPIRYELTVVTSPVGRSIAGLNALPRTWFAVSGIALLTACHDPRATPTEAAADAESAAAPRAIPAPSPSSATALAFNADHFSKKPYIPDVMELGRTLFTDPSLSASGTISCASCHDPRFAYGPPNERSTQLGGPDSKSPGVRAVPSLRYQQTMPRFSEHYFEEAGDESADQGPTGGHTWDGRADTLHDQARLPLTSPFEMANENIESVVAKVSVASYAPRFKQLFGEDVFDEPKRASTAVLLALEVFQQIPKDFYPYSSRYDAWLRKRGELNAQELRGFALFNDQNKANCAHCHPSHVRSSGYPQFTDFGFAALGVPRNPAIPGNADASFFDLGLCGPLRTDLTSHREYCGEFRAPSLRNVALRKSFFHNGVFHHLEEVIQFYATRDSNPGKWYPKAKGVRYDDLPVDAQRNVNQEPPFGRKKGQAPLLSGSEIKDLIAFLNTLTDEDLTANVGKM